MIKKKTIKKKVNKPVKKVKPKLTKQEILEIKQKEKKEKEENYLFFNKINGYIPSLNVIINEKNEYILIVKILDFDAMKYLIDRMENLHINEIQIFNYKLYHYLSIAFTKDTLGKDKKGNVKYDKITKFIKDFEWRSDEFNILRLPQIFSLLKDKIYRINDIDENNYIDNKKLRTYIINDKNNKHSFQTQIQARLVNINKEKNYITFNGDDSVKHRVLGFQMYPSFLFNGYLSELNYIKNVETCTYIKPINKEKCINAINNKKQISYQDLNLRTILKECDKLYNTCFFIHIYGDSETLEYTYNVVNKISNKYHVIINDFINQQKDSFKAFLPLMNNTIKCYRAISDISGILPYNPDIVKFFKNGLLYGKELITDNDFTYNRINSGVLLSSNENTKEMFLSKELMDFTNRFNKTFYKVDFNDSKKYPDVNFDKYFIKLDFDKQDLVNLQINEEKLYVLFKIYCYLCLSYYRDNIQIDKNDKETLDSVFYKLKEKIKETGEIVNYKDKVNRIKSFLQKNNKKLYDKINKEFINPDKEIVGFMKCFFKIMEYAGDYDKIFKNVCYVYNIDKVIDALDILFRYIFKNKFNTIFLFTSNNDFLVLNNDYVATEMMKAKYINIIDVQNNVITKVKRFLELPDDDIVHLNNKNYIAGMLYTDVCEFNYYIEKNNKDGEI